MITLALAQMVYFVALQAGSPARDGIQAIPRGIFLALSISTTP